MTPVCVTILQKSRPRILIKNSALSTVTTILYVDKTKYSLCIEYRLQPSHGTKNKLGSICWPENEQLKSKFTTFL